MIFSTFLRKVVKLSFWKFQNRPILSQETPFGTPFLNFMHIVVADLWDTFLNFININDIQAVREGEQVDQ